jgi:arylsulfatase A-like enzyme
MTVRRAGCRREIHAMRFRHSLAIAIVIFCAAMHAVPRAATDADDPQRPPNFVFILVDDLGWTDVGFMGAAVFETPNIDRLAGEGMVFTSAYANAPNCAPSRACLLTGQYTPRHGVYTVNSAERGKKKNRRIIPTPNTKTLAPTFVTIAEALRDAGYVSASIGKWHLGEGAETGPLGQGFEVNVGGHKLGHPKSYFSPYKNAELPDGPQGEHLTDRLTDEAIAFIEANREKAFFLYLPYYAVHTPIQAKKELSAKYREKIGDGGANPKYAAMIETTDDNIGRLMKRLEELEIDENTVVFFFSDNGGYAGVTTMAPLRGFKGMLYEGGIRVPMFVRWSGTIDASTKCVTPVLGTDFFPTILEMAGIERPDDQALDGVSLMPLLSQAGELERPAIFWHFPAYLESGKGVKGLWRTTPAGAVRVGDWKLIEFFEDGRIELYNLADDLGERNDLAETMPEKAAELLGILRTWRESVAAPVPSTPNPDYEPAGKGPEPAAG